MASIKTLAFPFSRRLDGSKAEALRWLCGDFNVVPTNEDIYNAGSWRFDACCSRKREMRTRGCSPKAGSTARAS